MSDQQNSTNDTSADDTSADDTSAGDGGTEMLGATSPGEDSAIKDPETWVTGDEPMTGAQKSYLSTLAREAGEEIPADITKAKASEEIERLQSATGRGQGT